MIANGVLGGLVAVTAGCASIGTGGAALIGIVAGALVYFATGFMDKTLKLDDVVSAVPVHAVCGAWGTLAVGLFILPEHMASGMTRMGQIWIQFQGVVTCFIWAFGVAFIMLKLINTITPIRVSREEEEIGLNISEHGAKSSLIDLATSMHRAIESGIYDESLKVEVEYGTEVGDLTQSFNLMVDTIQGEQQRSVDALMATEEALADAHDQRSKVEEEQKKAEIALQEAETQRAMLNVEQEQLAEALDELNRQNQQVEIERERATVALQEAQVAQGDLEEHEKMVSNTWETMNNSIDKSVKEMGFILGEASGKVGNMVNSFETAVSMVNNLPRRQYRWSTICWSLYRASR